MTANKRPLKPAKKKKVNPPDVSMSAFLAHGREAVAGSVAYMLRTCAADMSAYGGFVWPESGAATCPDWSPVAECGNGLHGLLWGEGDPSLTSSAGDAKWLVCAVWAADAVSIGADKIKAPRAWVVFCGARDEAVAEIQRFGATRPIYGTATAGDAGTATAGYAGTATAGDAGTATAGYAGTATAGDAGTATAGDAGTATAGYAGTATAGDAGTATAGYAGTATAGYAGTATAGDAGTATAGDAGTATAGYAGTATAGARGTATAGARGTATAGDDGIVCIKRWNGKRYRMCVAHVGEDGIEPRVPYRLNADGTFVRADKEGGQ
jgi:hypothetical protein